MVAYSFKDEFIDPIQERTKQQTIRALRTGRSRHARVGERLQIYNRMRRRDCSKILDVDPICTAVHRVDFDIVAGEPIKMRWPESDYQTWFFVTDGFAQSDGFTSSAQMRAFWEASHGLGRFEGMLIEWQPYCDSCQDEGQGMGMTLGPNGPIETMMPCPDCSS